MAGPRDRVTLLRKKSRYPIVVRPAYRPDVDLPPWSDVEIWFFNGIGKFLAGAAIVLIVSLITAQTYLYFHPAP